MKKIYSILAGLLLTATLLFTQQATAQAPQKMSYQSVIRNSSNVLLVNTAVGIKISVLQGSESGTAVYVETQTATTNANGLLSLQIGAGTADLTSITIPDSVTSIGNDAFTTGTFAGINWAAGPYFIKTETDPLGGTNYTITGTQEMLSVPYAMYSKNGISTAQADAIVSMQAQITTMQTQITSLNNTVTNNLEVGDIYQGGIIGYIFQSGDPGYVAGETHGLIAAQSVQSPGIRWNNGDDISTGATAQAIGTGRSNTDLIIAIQGPISTSYAAGLARAYNGGGYTDWFLPSYLELQKLKINRSIIGLDGVYWSSTESSVYNFIALVVGNGSPEDLKFLEYQVRAVRAF